MLTKLPVTVLVVDDEPDVCWALETLLRRNRFTVVTMGSGAEALRWFKESTPTCDIILLDAKLADIEGVELARRIRAETACAAPMILVSGYFYKDDSIVQETLRTGLISAFVTKPFHHDELLKAVHAALAIEPVADLEHRMPEKKFIYAVMANQGALPAVAAAPSGGIDAAPLETVCYRDMVALVSTIDASRFDPDLAGQAASAAHEARLKADLLKYQQVNSWLLEQTWHNGMLPLRFGLTARDRHEVERVLERVYSELTSYLDRLRGKVELVVQAAWDLQKIIPAIARDQPELLSADPVQTGKRLFEAAELSRKKLVLALHEQLAPFATDFSEGPRKAEEVILNRSYLVARAQEPLFDAAMNALGNQYEGMLNFRYIGPLPAYSFVNIELNQGNFALLDQARKTLQLAETATWPQIKSAYRKLLLIHHPDRNPDSPAAAARCKEVLAAYATVSAYWQSFQAAGEGHPQDELSFAQDAVEKIFIADHKGATWA